MPSFLSCWINSCQAPNEWVTVVTPCFLQPGSGVSWALGSSTSGGSWSHVHTAAGGPVAMRSSTSPPRNAFCFLPGPWLLETDIDRPRTLRTVTFAGGGWKDTGRGHTRPQDKGCVPFRDTCFVQWSMLISSCSKHCGGHSHALRPCWQKPTLVQVATLCVARGKLVHVS